MGHVSRAPFDVIESILKEVETGDLQSVIKSGPSFQAVSDKSKALWICHAHKILERCRYLDLPRANNLRDHSTQQLRSSVLKAISLEANWGSMHPKIVSVVTEDKAIANRYHKYDQLWKLSEGRVLKLTEGSSLLVFDLKKNVIVAEAEYRKDMLIRDCVMEYTENFTRVFCLMSKNPEMEFYRYGYEDETGKAWNFELLMFDLPVWNTQTRTYDTSLLKIVKLTKFLCSGIFRFGAILDTSKKLISVITKEKHTHYCRIDILQDTLAGKHRSSFGQHCRGAISMTLSSNQEQLFLYSIHPNSKVVSIAEVQYKDAERAELCEITISPAHEEFKWRQLANMNDPIGGSYIWDETSQIFFPHLPADNSKRYISTASVLEVHTSSEEEVEEGEDRGSDIGLPTGWSWIIMQHYSCLSPDGSHVNGRRCIVQLKNANETYNNDQDASIPMVDITFNHAAWIEATEAEGDEKVVKFATFPTPTWGADNLETIAEAQVTTLDIPIIENFKYSDFETNICSTASRITIDESRGAIDLYCDYVQKKLYTLYYV